jgi:hypothetical protein
VREYSSILSIAIAQTHTEQASRPSMIVFTTKCAYQNEISDTSAEATGKADCATSAGFMIGILKATIPVHARPSATVMHRPRSETPTLPIAPFRSRVAWDGCPEAGVCIPC